MNPLHTPRVVDITAAVVLLYLVNREAPRILPAIFGLLVLYALLTNVPRVVALIGESNTSLSHTFRGAARRP